MVALHPRSAAADELISKMLIISEHSQAKETLTILHHAVLSFALQLCTLMQYSQHM